MSLKITEISNDQLKVHNTPNNLDKPLALDIPEPLPNYSGFSMLICGASGSGKTTLLYSIMSKNKKKGVRQSYKGVFDKVYIISPTIGKDSIKNDPFKTIPEDQIWRSLTKETLDELDEKLDENRKDGINSIVILDDVGSQLRKSAAIDKKLTSMIQNRRHQYCSYITLLQRFRDAGTGIRNNLSHFISFRPKNKPEMDAIANELFPYDNKKNMQILNHIFETVNNFAFIFVDMSLKKTNKFLFYSGFNPLVIDEE
jgi:ABC-type dipeptide/oligopeptide/nickel transport system ATPase component